MEKGIPTALFALRTQLADYERHYRKICRPVESAIRVLEKIDSAEQANPEMPQIGPIGSIGSTSTADRALKRSMAKGLKQIVDRQGGIFTSRSILREFLTENPEATTTLAQVSKYLHHLRRRGSILSQPNANAPIPINYVLTPIKK